MPFGGYVHFGVYYVGLWKPGNVSSMLNHSLLPRPGLYNSTVGETGLTTYNSNVWLNVWRTDIQITTMRSKFYGIRSSTTAV